jgi:hypothetical protein
MESPFERCKPEAHVSDTSELRLILESSDSEHSSSGNTHISLSWCLCRFLPLKTGITIQQNTWCLVKDWRVLYLLKNILEQFVLQK